MKTIIKLNEDTIWLEKENDIVNITVFPLTDFKENITISADAIDKLIQALTQIKDPVPACNCCNY